MHLSIPPPKYIFPFSNQVLLLKIPFKVDCGNTSRHKGIITVCCNTDIISLTQIYEGKMRDKHLNVFGAYLKYITKMKCIG